MSLTGLKKPQLTWEVSIIASMHILTDQEVKAQRSQVHFPDATAYKWQCWDVVPESRHLVAHSHFFPFIPHLLHPPTKWLNPFIFDATSAHPLHEQLWCLHPTLHFSKHAHSCQPLRLSEKPRDVCCSGPIRWTRRTPTEAVRDQLWPPWTRFVCFVSFVCGLPWPFFFFKVVFLTQSFLTLVHVTCPGDRQRNLPPGTQPPRCEYLAKGKW